MQRRVPGVVLRVYVRAPARQQYPEAVETETGSLGAGRRGAVTLVMLLANVSKRFSPAELGAIRDVPVARRIRIMDGELRWAEAWA
jgi:hypothetical protein